ncbi:MAG TPA: YceI family protein [Nevskiaceae bacterium]|nr:YceI family protein [Nevskiaceae bacterium]
MKALSAFLLAAVSASATAAPETYPLDPNHTFPSFEFPHMGISVWRGKFDRSSGTVVIDRAAKTGTVDVQIDPASIDFGLAIMNDKAKSEDFFNVAKYPSASYKGKLVFDGDTLKAVDGTLTLMGVQKPVRLAVNQFNCIPHPLTKKQLCGADAEGEVIWGEFGMKASQWGQGDAGRTKLRIQVEGVKQD